MIQEYILCITLSKLTFKNYAKAKEWDPDVCLLYVLQRFLIFCLDGVCETVP